MGKPRETGDRPDQSPARWAAANLVLVGLRASGKTTVGQRVASLTGRSFVDLDEITLASFSERTVSEAWAAHGEPAWREAEVAAAAHALEPNGQVIAMGGGTPTVPAAHDLLMREQRATRSIVIYLRCDPDVLASRLRAATDDRPSLTGAPAAEEVDALFAARDPIYRRLADFEIDVTRLNPGEAARAILARLEPLTGRGVTPSSGGGPDDACG